MFAELYIEALQADQVWELWDLGVVTNDLAAWAQCILGMSSCSRGDPECSGDS